VSLFAKKTPASPVRRLSQPLRATRRFEWPVAILLILVALVVSCAGPEPAARPDPTGAEKGRPNPGLDEPLSPLDVLMQKSRQATSKPVGESPVGTNGDSATKPRLPSEDVEPAAGSTPSTFVPRTSAGQGDSDVVSHLLRDLKSDRKTAAATFRKLWSIPKDVIPGLIAHVDDSSPSALDELVVLVLNKETFADFNSETLDLRYKIPGMGDAEFHDIAAGKVPKGYKVKLRRRGTFPVGVVLRAALINRFRSLRQPPGNAVARPVEWWLTFYRRVEATL